MLRAITRPKPLLGRISRPFSQAVRYDLKPFIKLAKNYPSVGMLSVNGKQDASCVLVSDNIALTNAHCIPSEWWNRSFEAQFDNQTIAVQKVLSHPFSEKGSEEPSAIFADVSALFLKEKPAVKKAEIDFKKVAAANNCVAVGFSGFFSPTVDGPLQQLTRKKLAALNSVYCVPNNGTLESKIGYKANGEKTSHVLYGTRIDKGQSGGGLFRRKKLIGLGQGGYPCRTTGLCKTHLFVSLADHQVWLERVLHNNPLSDAKDLKKLDELIKRKVDPECEIAFEEGYITVYLPKIERLKLAELLCENGFFPALKNKENDVYIETLVLLDETFESVIEKLNKMPDVEVDLEKEEMTLSRDYSFS